MMEANRSRGGRPRDSFADPHVVPVEDREGNIIGKKCIYCDHQFSNKTSVTRIKAHLGKVPSHEVALCEKVPPDVEEAARSAMPRSGTSSRPSRRKQTQSSAQNIPHHLGHTHAQQPHPHQCSEFYPSAPHEPQHTLEALQEMEHWLLSSPQDGENNFGNDRLTAPEFTHHGLEEDPNCFPYQAVQQDDVYEDLEGLEPATNSLNHMSIETQQPHQHRTSESFSLAPQQPEHLLTEVRQEVHEMQPNESCSMHNLTSQYPTQQRLGEDPPCTSNQAKHEKKRKLDKSPPIGKKIPLATTFQGPTFNKKVAEIHASLEDDFVSRIGVYGMGGSGKTTIMKHICNLLLDDYSMPFNHVIWVTMSQHHKITRLRRHLASRFNVILPHNEDEVAQAASLYEGMRNKCYALILDDVWDKINLEEVGIPEPSRDNGCKLILTTRSLDVCRRMQCKPIYLDLLLEEEAWELFVKTLVFVPQNSIVEGIMKEVAKECACLPLAIVTVAGSMRGVFDVPEWRNALDSLKKRMVGFSDVKKEVIEKLKFSYYRLSEQYQKCLLVCALYPEDCRIDKVELVSLLISQGIIRSTESLSSAYNHGYMILNKLVNACLLTCAHIHFADDVLMHDLIRDMCLDIVGGHFLVKCYSEFPPDKSEYTEDVKKASLSWSRFKEIPSHIVPYCPKLSTLLLSRNRNLGKISCSFFMGFPNLQFLDLSDTSIHELPNSIVGLVSLNSLVLQRCFKLRRLPCLAPLKVLKKLDLHRSGVEEAPEGLGELVHLTYLDLDKTKIWSLPRLTLRNLGKLQLLWIGWIEITLDDVKELKNLEMFQGTFTKLEEFNEYVSLLLNSKRGPCVYDVRVSHWLMNYGIHRDIDGETGIFIVCGNKEERGSNKNLTELMFPQDAEIIIPSQEFVESFEIDDFEEDSHVLSELERVTLSSLHMSPIRLHHREKTEERGQPKGLFNAKLLLVFPNLRHLRVHNCTFMEELISTSPSAGVFSSSVELLNIGRCNKLVRLLAPRFLSCFQNLEDICIYDCASLVSIISAANPIEEEESDNAVCFPKLRHLILADLPNLRNICDGNLVCPSIENIHVRRCPKLKRLSLQLLELDDNGGRVAPLQTSLKVICGERRWWESLEWDHPCAKTLLQPYFKPCLQECYADYWYQWDDPSNRWDNAVDHLNQHA